MWDQFLFDNIYEGLTIEELVEKQFMQAKESLMAKLEADIYGRTRTRHKDQASNKKASGKRSKAKARSKARANKGAVPRTG
jgi:hypothetical protein